MIGTQGGTSPYFSSPHSSITTFIDCCTNSMGGFCSKGSTRRGGFRAGVFHGSKRQLNAVHIFYKSRRGGCRQASSAEGVLAVYCFDSLSMSAGRSTGCFHRAEKPFLTTDPYRAGATQRTLRGKGGGWQEGYAYLVEDPHGQQDLDD
jgi:hypothetical protein